MDPASSPRDPASSPRDAGLRIEACIDDETKRATILSDLGPLLAILPRWCARLIVQELEDDEEAPAGITGAIMATDCEYRRATLQVFPIFWTMDDETRRDVLTHEICHVVAEPLASLATLLVETGTPLEKRAVVVAVESIVEDMAISFRRVLR